jgi:hypothetical protein
MSINNIDLTTATKPIMLFVIRDNSEYGVVNDPLNIILNVKDSAGNLLMSWTVRVAKGIRNFFKVVAFDLSAVAGLSGLTFEIVQYNYCSTTGTVRNWRTTVYYDSIYIVDGGDKDYNIALLSLSNVDRTINYDIPEADRPLPLDSARISVNLATPPHPLNEDKDIFTYTAITNTDSASIISTDASHRHSYVVTPSISPSSFDKFSIRSYITTVTIGWHSFDEVVVVSFWSTGWELKAVYVFRVAITLNPYSPSYATAMINVTYGAGWSGSRDFSIKVHARSLTIACYVKYLVGDNTVVQSGTVKVRSIHQTTASSTVSQQ